MRKTLKPLAVILSLFLIAISVGLLLPMDTGDLKPLEEVETGWTFHTYVGLVLFVVFVLIMLVSQLNKRLPAFRSTFSRFTADLELSTQLKQWAMVVLGATGVYAYVYCHHICATGGLPIFDCEIHFFHMLFRFSLSLFPYFVVGCIVGGLIMKLYSSGRFKLPTSMVGGGVFAALIPVCSCGAVPLARGMLATGKIRVRTVITFLMVAPVLSPFVIPFSFQLGPSYAIARIIAIFVLAIISGIIIERLAGVKGEGGKPGCYSCQGCALSGSSRTTSASNPLVAGWDIMLSLLPFISFGIIIGALVAKYVPASVVGTYLSSDFVGLITATSITLPLFLCSGQEIVILAPLMNEALMGANAVPVGHAIAFTIAGTGICLSAIPALVPTIGKKAVVILVALFWSGSIILGLAINLVLGLLSL